MHICVSKLIWNRRNKIQKFIHFHPKKMHLKMSSAIWRIFCLGLNALPSIRMICLSREICHFLRMRSISIWSHRIHLQIGMETGCDLAMIFSVYFLAAMVKCVRKLTSKNDVMSSKVKIVFSYNSHIEYYTHSVPTNANEIIDPLWGESPDSSQRANNSESVCMSWRHHICSVFVMLYSRGPHELHWWPGGHWKRQFVSGMVHI